MAIVNNVTGLLYSILFFFLADCTNGRTYATVLRPSVVCNVLLWLNGASYRKTA